jgi:uncharacterized protein YecE (DUF72 family)
MRHGPSSPRVPSAPRASAVDGVVRVGTQGWNYSAWVGPFYPSDTRPAAYLSIYARAFDTVEIDATFHAIPSPSTVRGWLERAPPGFTYALKAPRELTHERKLRDATELAEEFFARAKTLGRTLGPILLQFGPDFGPTELPALAAFLPRVPSDIRLAVEFRHRGWIHDGVLALLAEHNVALALTDTRFIPRRVILSLVDRPTADFAYVRWLGSDRDLVDHSRLQVDRSRELAVWTDAIRRLQAKVGVVYAYMSNYFAGHAPASARMLQELLGQTPVSPERLGDQLLLF